MTDPLRSRLNSRLAALRTERYSWWVHWAEIAKYILPRRYNWLVTPNQYSRGMALNSAIIDSTATTAIRVLSSGMMSGITSPTRPWFRLRMDGYGKDDINPVNLWLAECERRMMRVFQESNFYNSVAQVYVDLAAFGTAPMLIYEDYENVIACYNPCAGEYYIGNNANLSVGIFFREIIMSTSQMVEEFGRENCSDIVQREFDLGGANLAAQHMVCHGIEPNLGKDGISSRFKYQEFYWEHGDHREEKFLRKKGYFENPAIVPRWDVSGNDAYGRSVGMDMLGDVKQLQQETRRKGQAIDKMANPPMVADVELKNQPASLLPGGVTYLTKKEGVGFKPAYENFRPPVQELMQDIEQIQKRIQVTAFNDLFLMFQNMQAEPRSAAAVDARREEKLIMLGPVLERFQTEALDPYVDRVFGIMLRGGLLPEAPPEIAGRPIEVEYVSMLAAAQSAVQTAGVERIFQVIGNLVGIKPEIVDTFKFDESIRYYGANLAVPPNLFPTAEEIAKVRAERAKAQSQAVNPDLAKGAADAAKTLSQTDLGGGQSALQAMIGQ